MNMTTALEHTITEGGHINVKEIRRYYSDNGELIATKYHRHVVSPDSDITGEAEETQRIANSINTPAKVEEYMTTQRNIQAKVMGISDIYKEIEEAEADGVVTAKERDTIFNKIKRWLFAG